MASSQNGNYTEEKELAGFCFEPLGAVREFLTIFDIGKYGGDLITGQQVHVCGSKGGRLNCSTVFKGERGARQ